MVGTGVSCMSKGRQQIRLLPQNPGETGFSLGSPRNVAWMSWRPGGARNVGAKECAHHLAPTKGVPWSILQEQSHHSMPSKGKLADWLEVLCRP